jgi:hypothetical protein
MRTLHKPFSRLSDRGFLEDANAPGARLQQQRPHSIRTGEVPFSDILLSHLHAGTSSARFDSAIDCAILTHPRRSVATYLAAADSARHF